MPRFFLHIETSEGRIEDPDGSELPDLNAAQAEALASARYLLSSAIARGRTLDARAFHISDDHGTVLMKVPLIASLME